MKQLPAYSYVPLFLKSKKEGNIMGDKNRNVETEPLKKSRAIFELELF